MKARVIAASAAVFKKEPRRFRAASLGQREERRAAKCVVKPGRRVLQARAGHRGKTSAKLAKNEAAKTRADAKKRRTLPKS